MSATPMSCPKCEGEMEQGFIVDYSHAALFVSQWAPGAPKKSFWQQTRLPKEGVIPVGTFRC